MVSNSQANTLPARFDFVLPDAHGVEICCYEWPADPRVEPQGVVQIAHGVGEHALRYEEFARALQRAGFTVVADDHRGHGQTGLRQHGGEKSRLGRLGPGGLRATEDALLLLARIAGERHPGLPLLLFAHSWGSLMAQRLLNRGECPWRGVVLSGSAFRTVRFMESGNLNRAFRSEGETGFEWLSRDLAVGQAFAADELCFYANLPVVFGVPDTLRLLGRPSARVPDVPLLITSGEGDPLSRGDGLARLAAAYRKRGVRDVTLRTYPGARHELLNELNREQVIADVITWLLERAG